MGGCIYFSKYRYKCDWEFLNGEFDWEFNNFYKFSNRIKKYFFRRNVNYINMTIVILIWLVTEKGIYLGITFIYVFMVFVLITISK